MRTLVTSQDQDLSFEIAIDWPTPTLVVRARVGTLIHQELGRYSIADLLLEYERLTENGSLNRTRLLGTEARISLQHGAVARRDDLEERRLAAFHRWSYNQLTH
jgi:hypothetical protein